MPYADFTKVPGPSPWYLKAGKFYSSKSQDYFWKHENSSDLSGITRMINSNGKTVIILDFQCYIKHMEVDKFLIWHEYIPNDKKIENGCIEFKILELDKLSEFQNYRESALNMRKERISIGIADKNGLVSECSISLQSEGKHKIESPDPFNFFEEVLVLSDYSEGKSNHFDSMYRAVYSFQFSKGFVEVFPQDWFNNGGLDFGYQWITQITRRNDGKLCGNGIRIDDFLLDETNKKLQK